MSNESRAGSELASMHVVNMLMRHCCCCCFFFSLLYISVILFVRLFIYYNFVFINNKRTFRMYVRICGVRCAHSIFSSSFFCWTIFVVFIFLYLLLTIIKLKIFSSSFIQSILRGVSVSHVFF